MPSASLYTAILSLLVVASVDAFVVGRTSSPSVVRQTALHDAPNLGVPADIRRVVQQPLSTSQKAPNPFAVDKKDPLRQPGVLPSEKIIRSVDELDAFVHDLDDNRITVVKFHAAW